MPNYRKKPVVVEASQWFKLGDHPEVGPYGKGAGQCDQCPGTWEEHGSVSTLEGCHIVCVGDWIIKGVAGEYYPCKPGIFDATYEWVK